MNDPQLVGESNTVAVNIQNVDCSALLDTGSTVSTIAESFYHEHLSSLPLQPLQDILDIECANGENLPYKGFVQCSISSPGLPVSTVVEGLFLIVPDSPFNQSTPVLIGTNLLDHFIKLCESEYGRQFLQRASLHTPWFLSFRSLRLQEKSLKRNKNKLASLKCASKFIIPPNKTVDVSCFCDGSLPYKDTCAIVQPCKDSIYSSLEICPIAIPYGQRHLPLNVPVTNLSEQTIVLSEKCIIAQLQPVTVENNVSGSQTSSDSSQEPAFLEQIQIDESNLTPEQYLEAKRMLSSFEDIFSKGDEDIGFCNLVKHRIDLVDPTPFKQRYRTIPPSMFDEVREHLQKLLACGIIKKSHSPYASNIVLVRKKSGELRLCVDFRQLNNLTKKDSYALPRIDDILNTLAGSTYYTVLDMKSGYYQVELEERHKERTAFTAGPLGFYQYERLPFGLACAPATYQRLMEECLGDLNLKICVIYLDDIIIFAKTYEEHMTRLQQVLQRLRECNLKLAPKKCKFFQSKVTYVGHVVSSDGIGTDPSKIEKIQSWPKPKSPEEVRSFLGFAGYYRKYVKGFSSIAQPLSKLIPGSSTSKKSRKKSKTTSANDSPPSFVWGSDQDKAFTELKRILSSPPILAYADFSLPFELHTDASSLGLGAVLYQEQSGIKRVISYASRGLSKAEKNYSAHRLEFLALKWSITEKFADYLYGQHFQVFTDNNPLTYVLSSAKLDATGHRWLAALAAFDFDLVYRPGHANADADGLSRIPGQTTLSSETIRGICNPIQVSPVETICCEQDVVDNIFTPDYDEELEAMSPSDWRKAQREDPVLSFWVPKVVDQKTAHRKELPTSSHKSHLTMLKTQGSLKMVRGVLYRVVTVHGEERKQLVLPEAYIPRVLTSFHDNIGHQGIERTTSIIQRRFYWPGMNRDIQEHIDHCRRCLLFKKSPSDIAPLVNITTCQPFELLCIDFLTLDRSKGGIENVLVITDHFTRFAHAIPTRNQSARTTAEALLTFFNDFGYPQRLHSDQGANFCSKIIKEICNLAGITKSRTSPYHAMGNGQCERFNRTLISMIGTLDQDLKSDWKKHIQHLVYAYNCTVHKSTGYTPFELMFGGRVGILPGDLQFGIASEKKDMKFIENLKDRIQKTQETAKHIIKNAQETQKQQYDLTAKGTVLHTGDRVLVKVVKFDGRHKLEDKWEHDVYKVLKQIGIPAFQIHRTHVLVFICGLRHLTRI